MLGQLIVGGKCVIFGLGRDVGNMVLDGYTEPCLYLETIYAGEDIAPAALLGVMLLHIGLLNLQYQRISVYSTVLVHCWWKEPKLKFVLLFPMQWEQYKISLPPRRNQFSSSKSLFFQPRAFVIATNFLWHVTFATSPPPPRPSYWPQCERKKGTK